MPGLKLIHVSKSGPPNDGIIHGKYREISY